MSRSHNFSAGPAVLPEPVLRQAQKDIWELNESGVGLLECSHRSPTFDAVICSARERIKRLLKLDEEQEVLFLHGGARSQFYMVPMNLLRGGRAVYLETGCWSKYAINDARLFGQVDVPFSSADTKYDRVPAPRRWEIGDARYLHYTSNNTIAGTEYSYIPQTDGWLMCDMSSDFLARELDGSKFDLIYGGAQKNLGPAGVTVVVLRRSLLEHCDPNLPKMLQYGIHVDKGSMFNTPCTFGIYVVEKVCRWIEEDMGGVAEVEKRNRAQAGKIYDTIDKSSFWQGQAQVESRSLMNITFTTGDQDLDLFVAQEAAKVGLSGLRGHRSVGGLRASIYNAQTDAAVDDLVGFLIEFERTRG